MSLRRLTAFVTLVWFIGLGAMFGFFLAGAAAVGGRLTLDMTVFGELWPEYFLVLATTGLLPYALYVAERELLDL